MQYIGDPNAFLLAYATDSPAVDEPSAGYIFTWDMLGNGNVLPIRQFEGEQGTHSEFIEGLMATDMKRPEMIWQCSSRTLSKEGNYETDCKETL